MPPNERSFDAGARARTGSGPSPRRPEPMAGPEVPRARSASTDHHPEWDESAWHSEDARAASDRARLLLKRRTGTLFSRFGERMRALQHGVLGSRWVRFGVTTAVALLLVFFSGFAVLWWRLGTGPINLDVITPWLVRAIEDNLGSDHTVEVGGTQIERAGRIRVAVRIRDIVVRDRSHAVVASAPKAEVRISTTALLAGRLRAQSLNLVGAELSVRISTDGRVIISTGESARPLATAQASPASSPRQAAPSLATPNTAPPSAAIPAPTRAPSSPATSATGGRSGLEGLLAGLEWLDGLSKSGLDGENLDEVGLKNGSLIVEDQRIGNLVRFQNISLSLRRPRNGGVALSLGEEGRNPWSLKAAIGAPADGVRSIDIQADKVPARNIVLAFRTKDVHHTAELPLSGHIKGEIGRDGLPTYLSGKVTVGAGQIIDLEIPNYPMEIDSADISVEWDAARRAIIAPLQIISGVNRFTLLARLDPPNDSIPNWQLGLNGGTILFGGENGEEPLIFNRIAIRFRFDTDNRRILMSQADFSNGDISIACSGFVDYSSAEPRLNLGLAGTPMSVSALKRIWPILIAPEVREWVIARIDKGTLQRIDIAMKTPLKTLSRVGTPMADDALAINLLASNVVLRPVDEFPPLHDAELKAHVTGRTASVTIGQASVDTPAGRRVGISDLAFEIPDLVAKPPLARVRFRLDGPVPAVVEMLSSDKLSDISAVTIDPNTSRGNVTAQVTVGFPIKPDLKRSDANYAINVDLGGFSAEKLVMNQKLEGNTLKVLANNQGYQVKGDVKIGGQPASLDYRKPAEGDADVRLQATLDDAGRARLGVDLGTAVSGSIPVKVSGKLAGPDRESRLSVEADLTAARIDNLLPGWTKVAGKASKITFAAVQKPQSMRLEDIAIEGGGVQIKGALELDPNGDVLNAAFPLFSPSEGDKASLKAERTPDGMLKVMVRGDVFDARAFIKSLLSGTDADPKSKKPPDLDVDLKLGAVAGYYGEAVRGVDVKLTRRGGLIKAFQFSGKIGRDTPIVGDIRGRNEGREVLYLETNDAGALFRFADIYSKVIGGKMWMAMDPPNGDATTQEGLLNVRDFVIKGEAALDRVVSGGPPGASSGVGFSHMRAEFSRQGGQFAVREGLLAGPTVGATIEGTINANQVRMSGTFVPVYGLNNMFGQLPVLGLVLGGGSNEGLIGITYEVVGSMGAPVVRVNPISAMAPGVLRKIFEFGTGKQASPSDNFPSPNN
ncbi:MAG: DUF3971 domain-containing protein [Xanthobacteraceae bacterium]